MIAFGLYLPSPQRTSHVQTLFPAGSIFDSSLLPQNVELLGGLYNELYPMHKTLLMLTGLNRGSKNGVKILTIASHIHRREMPNIIDDLIMVQVQQGRLSLMRLLSC